MALFEDFSEIDVIRPVKHLVDNGSLKLGKDNTIIVTKEIGVQCPWKFQNMLQDRKCNLWHDIYFNKYGHQAKGCFNCWKIVVKPKSLKELMQMVSLQKKLDLPSKCGIDKRNYTDCLYSGYWYCPLEGGLDEARKLYKTVKKEVRKKVHDMSIILKRGCTEMELRKGPSDSWEWTERDEMLEALLDSVYREETRAGIEQIPILGVHIFTEWVRWAFMHGDETWKEFCSVPLAMPVVTYHDSKHESQDFVISDFESYNAKKYEEKKIEII